MVNLLVLVVGVSAYLAISYVDFHVRFYLNMYGCFFVLAINGPVRQFLKMAPANCSAREKRNVREERRVMLCNVNQFN